MPPNNRRESHAPLPKAVLITQLYAVGKEGQSAENSPSDLGASPSNRPRAPRTTPRECDAAPSPCCVEQKKRHARPHAGHGIHRRAAGAGEPNRQPPPARPTSRTGVLPARAHVKDGGRSADGSRGIVRRLHLGSGLGRRRPVQRPGGLIFTRRRSRECCRAGGQRFRAALPWQGQMCSKVSLVG